jgi:hypothetical protein
MEHSKMKRPKMKLREIAQNMQLKMHGTPDFQKLKFVNCKYILKSIVLYINVLYNCILNVHFIFIIPM